MVIDSAYQALQDVFWRGRALGRFRSSRYPERSNVRDDLRDSYGFTGDLADIFCDNTGKVVHKWHHFLPIYERHFAPFRNRPIRFLEIGVSRGGSLAMWRKYFGPEAIIYGIDIDPECAAFQGSDGQVRIGSQADPDFLRRVVAEMGGLDIVLDDGSHVMAHIKRTLETLFPLLDPAGVYMIEDLHTAYWRRFGGGFWRRGNFFNYTRQLVDDMHSWYHVTRPKHPVVSDICRSIQIYDSIVVLEKGRKVMPLHSQIPSPDAAD